MSTFRRDALVVFSGVSGSGKSSLAFGTLYAEAQRRYFESVAPYARRLIDQVGVPDVDSIDGLPPAVALQQQRGTPGARSSVGSVTTLSSLVRMLYSRAGTYPPKQPMLYAEDFSPNTPQGACPHCHGLGRVYDVSEEAMVPDDTLTIRERAIASWPPAWHGQNLRDILVTLGYDVDRPWRELPKKDRDWILYHRRTTDGAGLCGIHAGRDPGRAAAQDGAQLPGHLHQRATLRAPHLRDDAQSTLMKRRVARFVSGQKCPVCAGKRLKRAALSVTFAGMDIGTLAALPLDHVAERLRASCGGSLRASRRGKTRSIRLSRERRRKDTARRVAAGGSSPCRRPGREADAEPFGGEAPRRATHRRDIVAADRDAAGTRARLPVTRPDHADAVSRRTPALAAGHADALEPLRRRLRA